MKQRLKKFDEFVTKSRRCLILMQCLQTEDDRLTDKKSEIGKHRQVKKIVRIKNRDFSKF